MKASRQKKQERRARRLVFREVICAIVLRDELQKRANERDARGHPASLNYSAYRVKGNFQLTVETSCDVNFQGTVFEGTVDIDHAVFKGNVDFGATFLMRTSFTQTKFFQKASFSATRFARSASFDGTTFLGSALFEGAQFSGECLFRDATFESLVRFDSATFNGNALFEWVTCGIPGKCTAGPISFCEARFLGEANFSDATFLRNAQFNGAHFHNDANFRCAEFLHGVSFKRCVFDMTTDFGSTRFHGAPHFHDAKLPHDVSFHEAEFHVGRSNEQSDTAHDRNGWTAEDLRAFRTLKLLMAATRAQHEEIRFFQYQMRAQRHSDYAPVLLARPDRPRRMGRPLLFMMSYFYDYSSGFGSSPTRALFGFGLWNLAFLTLFYGIESVGPMVWQRQYCLGSVCLGLARKAAIADVSAWPAFGGQPALALTLQNIFNPLAMLSQKALVTTSNISIIFLSLVQAVGSLAIFTLLLLAIRSVFQKGSGGGS